MKSSTVVTCILTALSASAWAGCSSAVQMPAYPDVWEWTPFGTDSGQGELGLALLTDGDVIVTTTTRSGSDVKRHGTALFGSNARTVARLEPTGKVVYSDGSVSEPLRVAGTEAVLSDGSTVTHISNAYRDCYRGPARDVLVRRDRDGKFIHKVVAFYLLDTPKHFTGGGGRPWRGEPDASCPNEPPLNLTVGVESMSGLYLALPDDTFLMLDREHARVQRFDNRLQSRSKLANRRVFVFEYHDDPLFVSTLTRKDYGAIEDGSARYQDALNDLRRYLLDIN